MTQTDVTVDLYPRADTAGTAAREQERARERVQSLDAVAATTVTEWEEAVPVDRHPTTTAREALDGIVDWARRAGVRLHPAVATRTRCAHEGDGRYRAVVLPVVALVVRDGDSPRGVFPHRGDDFRTVGDALDELESGHVPGAVGAEREPAVAD